jgi:hypothetical protein
MSHNVDLREPRAQGPQFKTTCDLASVRVIEEVLRRGQGFMVEGSGLGRP